MEKPNQHVRPQENMTLEDNIMACWGIVNEINFGSVGAEIVKGKDNKIRIMCDTSD